MSEAVDLPTGALGAAPPTHNPAALPDPLAPLVSDIVRRTRLWRSEKAEVTQELVAHFQDGLSRGESAAGLTERFGDPRMASKLIRRSKRRNRPWWWQAWRRSWQAVGIFIAALISIYLVLAIRYYSGEPGPIHDYLADLNAPARAIAAENRAWPMYREALLAMPELKGENAPQAIATRPGDPRWAEAERFLLDHQAQLQQVRAAASLPALGFVAGFGIDPADHSLWPDQEDQDGSFGLMGVLLPHFAEMQRLARIVAMDARRAAAAGDGATALADLAALMGLARHVREFSSVISGLVGIAILQLMNETTGEILADHPDLWTDAQLHELAHRLTSLRPEDIRVDFVGERYFFIDFIQRIYTDDGEGDGRLAPIGLSQMNAMTNMVAPAGESLGIMNLAGPLAMAVAAGRRDMLERHDQYMDRLEAEAARPLWQQRLDQVEQEVERLHEHPVERIRYLPLGLLLPALGKAAQSGEYAIARLDALQVAIALELHRRRYGAWPASLTELTPSLLPAIPPDRFDGKPLRYALVDGIPVLYSVGTDREDDGGRLSKQQGTPKQANDAARRWWSLAQIAAQATVSPRSAVADGDWILWPPVIDPPQPVEAADGNQ